ncbi:MAG: hypothetical protein AAF449_17925, partial [Myxococcota bacterium]
MSEPSDRASSSPSDDSLPDDRRDLRSPLGWRWIKKSWWLAGMLGFFGLIVAVIVMLPALLPPQFVRQQLERALNEDLGVPIEVGELAYRPLSGFDLRDVRVKPAPGFERDPLRVRHLRVRYRWTSLLWGQVAVRSVTLEDAAVVYEIRGDRNNVDALMEGIDAALGPAESPPPVSVPRPLMPITVLLQDISVGPVRVEWVGDGASGELADLWVRGSSRLGTRAMTASIAISLEPAAESNFRFARTAPDLSGRPRSSDRDPSTDSPAGTPLAGQLLARLRWPLSFRADTQAGFRLGPTSTTLTLNLDGYLVGRSGPLPPIDVDLSWAASYAPQDARAELSLLQLTLNEQTLVDARASVSGLTSVLRALLKDASAAELALPLGLPSARGGATEEDDRLSLDVMRLNLPLTSLFPVAQVVLPGLVDAGGVVHAQHLRVAGSVSTFLRGQPPELTGTLLAKKARIRWPGVVEMQHLDGSLQASRSMRGEYQAQGRFELRSLDAAGQRVGLASVAVAAGVERLDTATGATTATVAVEVTELAAGPLVAATVAASLFVRGRDPLVQDRIAPMPVQLRATVKGERVEVRGANLSFERIRAESVLRTDRLVDPAPKPWRVTLATEVEGLRQAAFRLGRGQLKLSGRVGDERKAGYA